MAMTVDFLRGIQRCLISLKLVSFFSEGSYVIGHITANNIVAYKIPKNVIYLFI